MEMVDMYGTMAIGGCIGFLLAWMMARSGYHATLQQQVESKVEALRKKVEERTARRVEEEVREDMAGPVRRELVEKFTAEAREAAQQKAKRAEEEGQARAQSLVQNAEIEARTLVLEARDVAEKELKDRRAERKEVEARLSKREEKLDERATCFEKRASEVNDRAKMLEAEREELRVRKGELQERIQEVKKAIEEAAEYSAEEAREELKARMLDQAKLEAGQRIKEIEEEAQEDGEKRARKILAVATQRFAGDFVTEKCVNVISLPSDTMKGRIIGREGRNIRALEAVTGVDIIIDDTPEVVVVSSFDPVRREIARRSLEKLISDGRIHPAHIEEVVEKTDQEVAQVIKDAGEKAALELGIHGLHSDLLKLVGQLKFRTSYGQNMWSHSIEVGFLCGLMASELGVSVADARRAGLLHDIGKALTHERQESHALVGAEIAAKCGEKEIVRNAIAAHHNDEPQNSVIAHLVIAADALSGARPGARREILGTYVKRLEDLERISSSFDGVQKSYAIQAGREIRVMVEHATIDDDGAYALSREIARRIEDELTYPGQIKVTVIRETRATGYAR